jgi:hypothetical protein
MSNDRLADYWRMSPAEQLLTLGARLYDRMTPELRAKITASLRPEPKSPPPEPPSPPESPAESPPRAEAVSDPINGLRDATEPGAAFSISGCRRRRRRKPGAGPPPTS